MEKGPWSREQKVREQKMCSEIFITDLKAEREPQEMTVQFSTYAV